MNKFELLIPEIERSQLIKTQQICILAVRSIKIYYSSIEEKGSKEKAHNKQDHYWATLLQTE